MSKFAVTVEEIADVRPHGNADRLEIGQVKGMTFQFVIARDHYKPGDKVVYFPLDSLIPEDLQEVLGVAGYLSRNRVRTVKLRGMISQGLVTTVEKIDEYLMAKYAEDKTPGFCISEDYRSVGTELQDLLGVEKYEPPEMEVQDAIQKGLPAEVSMYDIEGADRYPEVAERLMDLDVTVSEKLEGMNVWFLIEMGGATFRAGQRRRELVEKEDGEHWLFNWARKQDLLGWLRNLFAITNAQSTLLVRGEAVGPGIQKNYYGLDRVAVRFFDIEVDGMNLDHRLLETLLLPKYRVPIIHSGKLRDWLGGQSIQEAADGTSFFCQEMNVKQKRREGVVITPLHELPQDEKLGRVFIKQRGPLYLSKEKD